MQTADFSESQGLECAIELVSLCEEKVYRNGCGCVWVCGVGGCEGVCVCEREREREWPDWAIFESYWEQNSMQK